jgi:hypothetical protein
MAFIDQFTGQEESMSDRAFLHLLRRRCQEHGIDLEDPRQCTYCYGKTRLEMRKKLTDTEVHEVLTSLNVPKELKR